MTCSLRYGCSFVLLSSWFGIASCSLSLPNDNPFDPDNAGELATSYDLTATAEINAIKLSWTRPGSDIEVSHWVVLRRNVTDDGFEGELDAKVDGATTSYIDSWNLLDPDHMVAGKEYAYRVAVAGGNGGAVEGTYSADVKAVAVTDVDGDGFLDDGDKSGVAGDTLCKLGAGVTDQCDDNCPLTPNTDQNPDSCADPDGDCVFSNGDGSVAAGDTPCDGTKPGSDPQGGTCVDVPDCDDNCPSTANPLQKDFDGDGEGDLCDSDDDDDGVLDADDNCPKKANADQKDLDGDDKGDACDADIDGDGVNDDGDGSGVVGDNPCTSNNTTGCDDNCLALEVGPDDCSSAAVNAAIAAASAGDRIELSCTGTVSWSEQVDLSGGKVLAGPGQKGASGPSGEWPLVIEIASSDSAGIFVTCEEGEPANRITGLKIQGGGPTWGIGVMGRGTGQCGQGAFRIDNNSFEDLADDSRLIMTDGSTGKLTGLVDHNVFFAAAPGYNNISYLNGYQGSSDTCYGYDALMRDTGFGTDDFVFYEDNYFFNTGLETSDGGGRLVVRHNEFVSDYTNNSMWAFDGHGADTFGHNAAGVVACEFYNNTISGAQAYAQVAYMRGGKWMVHNNAAESGSLEFTEYRAYGSPNCEGLDWNACDGAACCIAACMQCPTAADFASCYPLPNQIQDTVLWSNIQDGANMVPWHAGDHSAAYIALDRDYWMPPYGADADRPVSCVQGELYGSTDSGSLWECTAADVWTLRYAPYAYPHPAP